MAKLPRTHWFTRYAQRASVCWLCDKPVSKGDKVTPYGEGPSFGKKLWPHLECAQAHEGRICTRD